jgi:hypothetical protein
MNDQHLCLSFWGPWAQWLFVFFEGDVPVMGRGDGLTASPETYAALCAVQRAIEYATADVDQPIAPWKGGPSPLAPETELLFQLVAQQFLVGLSADQFDEFPDPPVCHCSPFAALPRKWITDFGVAENDGAPPSNAVQVLAGPGAGPGTDLLGRVKVVLDSGLTIVGDP